MSVIKEEYMQNKVSRYDLLPISFLKKSAYTGSRDRLRYRIEKTETGEDENIIKLLRVTSWTTPFSFDHTPEDEKTVKDYPFEDASLDLIIRDLNSLLEDLKK